jgi:hypothetical protein
MPFTGLLTAKVHCTIFLAAARQMADNSGPRMRSKNKNAGAAMNDIWDTKDGRRRVRRDPPTVEEAVLAAQGLTDELKEQIEIVASLMEVPVDEARGAVLRMGQGKDVSRVTIAGRGAGAARAVVVERRTHRHPVVQRRLVGR